MVSEVAEGIYRVNAELPGGPITVSAFVVDAVCSGGAPGTVYTFNAAQSLEARFRHRGTHTFSLADVIELARALDRLPAHLAGYGIEGAAFELGAGLSPEVEAAVEAVTGRLLAELKAGV